MSKTKPPQQMICVKGKVLFEQGAPSHEAYFVEKGRVSVSITEDSQTMKLAEIGEGEMFGEMGVLDSETRMATVTALENTTLTVITTEDLKRRIGETEDKYIRSLLLTLIRRLRASGKEQVRHYKNLVQFQNRIAGLADKAGSVGEAIDREGFAAEVTPLLDQLDKVLDKYRK